MFPHLRLLSLHYLLLLLCLSLYGPRLLFVPDESLHQRRHALVARLNVAGQGQTYRVYAQASAEVFRLASGFEGAGLVVFTKCYLFILFLLQYAIEWTVRIFIFACVIIVKIRLQIQIGVVIGAYASCGQHL